MVDENLVFNFSNVKDDKLRSFNILNTINSFDNTQKVLRDVRQFCFDKIILSGHNPRVVAGTLYYLKCLGDGQKLGQSIIAERFGISTVALRNNVKKVRQSKHWNKIKVMLNNPNVERKV